MATYKIISDNSALGKSGDSVSSDALEGLNVDALIEGGHIQLVVTSARRQEKKDEE